MNPLKYAFGIILGKFLGFLVRQRGIEVHPAKIKATIKLTPPKNIRELKWLKSRLAYVHRFIFKLFRRYKPFSGLIPSSNGNSSVLRHSRALNHTSRHHLSWPAPLMESSWCNKLPPGLLLGALLAQETVEGKKHAFLYYLSRPVVGPKERYTFIEKVCLVFILTIHKLRHYLRHHQTTFILKADPVRYILN